MQQKAQVISLTNVRGGCGQSTLSLNLAVSLKQESKGNVALIDFANEDPYLQQMPKLLGIEGGRSLEQLVLQTPQIDPQIIRGFLPSHSSGIDFIIGADYMSTGALTPLKIGQVIDALKYNYDYILINLREFTSDDISLSIFDNTQLIFFVILPDLVSLFSTERKYQIITECNYPPQMVKFVLNRAGVAGGLPERDVRRFLTTKLQQDLFFMIADDPETVNSSINRSEPAVNFLPRAEYSRTIRDLGRFLNDENHKYYSEEREGIFNITGMPEHDFSDSDGDSEVSTAAEESLEGQILQLKKRVHQRLVSELQTQNMDVTSNDPQVKQRLHTEVSEMIRKVMGEEATFLTDRSLRKQVMEEIFYEAVGLGCLEKLLRDPDITEIMVNNENTIYVEKAGKIQLSDEKFLDRAQLLTIIERIVAPLGRRIDESQPLVDGRLEDGSRVNAIIPPLALNGPTVTIRLFEEERMTTADLINFGSLTREMEVFLKTCVRIYKNILIMGGTGSGKTTLLNMVASFIPPEERVLTIEDSAELQLPHEHWVRLESRPANIEGGGAIPIQQLIINALRMRPDRIVVGECRGGEALDMLQAMNTGHDGSLTTIHANSPQDAIGRLNTMVLMSGMELPRQAILEQIYGAINIIVHATRYSDGTRKICSVTEVTGFEDGEIQMRELMGFVQTGIVDGKIQGHFKAHGILPQFADEIKSHGEDLDFDIFKEHVMETGPDVLTEEERIEIQRKRDLKDAQKKGDTPKAAEKPSQQKKKEEEKVQQSIEIETDEKDLASANMVSEEIPGSEASQFSTQAAEMPEPVDISTLPQDSPSQEPMFSASPPDPFVGSSSDGVPLQSPSEVNSVHPEYSSPAPFVMSPDATEGVQTPPQVEESFPSGPPPVQQVEAEELFSVPTSDVVPPSVQPESIVPSQPGMSEAENRLKELMNQSADKKQNNLPDNNVSAEELL